MKRRSLALLFGAAMVTMSSWAQSIPEPKTDFDLKADLRYPKDLKVTPISDKTLPALKKFAGRWAGQYNGVMNVVLVFENLEDPENIMYSHSVAITPAYNIMRKLVARPKMKARWDAASGKIMSQFEATQVQQFSLTPEGWLKIEYEEKGTWNSLGYLKRVQDVPSQPSGAPVPAPFKMAESE